MNPFHITFIGVTVFAVTLSGCGGTDTPNLSAPCLTQTIMPISINGGITKIGSHQAYPEEAPQREVRVDAFDIDATEVTNAQFAEFVAATGYVTDAEKPQPGFDRRGCI